MWSSLHRSTLALRDAPPAGGVTTGNYTTMLHHGLFAALPVLPMALLVLLGTWLVRAQDLYRSVRVLAPDPDRPSSQAARADSAGGPPVPGQTR